MPGFARGRNLDKIGLKAQDTAELFFDDVRVPAENLLGAENRGFFHLMENLPQERLSIAVGAVAAAETVLAHHPRVRDRRGRRSASRSASFQNTRFVLAELHTEIDDRAHVRRPLRPRSSTPASSPPPTPRGQVVDDRAAEQGRRPLPAAARRLRLHGRVPDREAWRDARVQSIYGGTTEIMKEIIGRSLGL